MVNSQRKPVKVQLSVKLILPKINEDTDKIEVQLNTHKIPVFAQGLAKETFFEMLEIAFNVILIQSAWEWVDSRQNQNCGIENGQLWTSERIVLLSFTIGIAGSTEPVEHS